jgi:FtsZ-interacting cell division protein YlmF
VSEQGGHRRGGTTRPFDNRSGSTVRVVRRNPQPPPPALSRFWDMPGLPVVRPQNMQDATSAAALLQAYDEVLLDLAALDHATQRRVLDFTAGIVYGLDATMRRLGATDPVFLLTPK